MFLEDDPGSWFCMGTVIALVMLLVTTVLFYGVGYTGAFSLALSMNCTRRRFLLDYSLKILAHLVLGYLLVLGFYRLELLVGNAAFPDYPLEQELGFLTNWRVVTGRHRGDAPLGALRRRHVRPLRPQGRADRLPGVDVLLLRGAQDLHRRARPARASSTKRRSSPRAPSCVCPWPGG